MFDFYPTKIIENFLRKKFKNQKLPISKDESNFIKVLFLNNVTEDVLNSLYQWSLAQIDWEKAYRMALNPNSSVNPKEIMYIIVSLLKSHIKIRQESKKELPLSITIDFMAYVLKDIEMYNRKETFIYYALEHVDWAYIQENFVYNNYQIDEEDEFMF